MQQEFPFPAKNKRGKCTLRSSHSTTGDRSVERKNKVYHAIRAHSVIKYTHMEFYKYTPKALLALKLSWDNLFLKRKNKTVGKTVMLSFGFTIRYFGLQVTIICWDQKWINWNDSRVFHRTDKKAGGKKVEKKYPSLWKKKNQGALGLWSRNLSTLSCSASSSASALGTFSLCIPGQASEFLERHSNCFRLGQLLIPRPQSSCLRDI